jgi:hypothetical protein
MHELVSVHPLAHDFAQEVGAGDLLIVRYIRHLAGACRQAGRMVALARQRFNGKTGPF